MKMGMSPAVKGPSGGAGRLRAPHPYPWQHCHAKLAALYHSASAPAGLDSSLVLQDRPSVSHTRETIGNKSTLATLPCRVAHSVEGDRVVVRDRAPAPGKGCIPLWLALRLPWVCPQVAPANGQSTVVGEPGGNSWGWSASLF